MSDCNHPERFCLNPYEFIRKYQCKDCGAVMMCSCDERFGRRFLPHQLREGSVLHTRERVPVTHGFQERICNPCRGLPEEAAPKAPLPGSTSKIQRYYWREIFFETTIRFDLWAKDHGHPNVEEAWSSCPEERDEIERQVIEELKAQHDEAPKYQYQEESQSELIARCAVDVLNLHATYVRTGNKRVSILHEGVPLGVEDFVARHFEQQGYTVLKTESSPFHVLFGIYCWSLIQWPSDPKVRMVGWGHRTTREPMWGLLPDDFGAPGYGERRRAEIEDYFKRYLMAPRPDRDHLLWFFDYQLEPSECLRQYLWAHEDDDIKTARQLVTILPPPTLLMILRYLVDSYWERYCGWPDLLAHRNNEFLFVEVKSSSDKLSEDQKNWISDNHNLLHLPFKLAKVHRTVVIDSTAD